MSHVYSTRFTQAHAGGGASYTVPAGYRLVLKCITAFNANALVSQAAQVHIPGYGVTLWQANLGPQASHTELLTVVMFETEEFETVGGADVDVTTSGYLLSLP